MHSMSFRGLCLIPKTWRCSVDTILEKFVVVYKNLHVVKLKRNTYNLNIYLVSICHNTSILRYNYAVLSLKSHFMTNVNLHIISKAYEDKKGRKYLTYCGGGGGGRRRIPFNKSCWRWWAIHELLRNCQHHHK